MPVDIDALSRLASQYARGMTSIRGRRVQRLLQREFAGADRVVIVQVGSGASAVLGLSDTGAAICLTDGRGKHASVVKWRHGATQAFEVRFDLFKDSLPVVATLSVSVADLAGQVRLGISARFPSTQDRARIAQVFEARA
jgi:hypothetical protein